MTSNSDRREDRSPVLVVGGRGFVGSHVVRRLIAQGRPVHLFGPPVADDLLADLAGRFAETSGSVEDRSGLRAVLAESGAKAIVTTAAHGSGRQGLMRSGEAEGDRAMAVNVLGLRNLLEAAIEAGAKRVVWTSSTVVYGPPEFYPPRRVNEDAACDPRTFYGLTKRLGEDLARYYMARHGLSVAALRLPLVLGPGLWYQGAAAAIADVIRSAAPGARRKLAFHDEPIDFMDVRDVAEAVVHALDPARPPSGIYNINGLTARLTEIVAALEASVPGYRVDFERRAPELLFPLIDDSRFRREAEFTPARGLSQMIAGMREQGEGSCTKNA